MSSSILHLKTAHLIGIKGAGMTALAELMAASGVKVTGSDTEERFYTDAILKGLGIVPNVGFRAENLPKKCDRIIYSTAYSPEKNEELKAALASGTPVSSYPEAIGLLSQEYLTLAVCGTHGKTTTSALLANTLSALGANPAAIVGSKILGWGGSALFGRGKHLVLEADEYQNKLAHYSPHAAILTSVDWDHPDFFPTVEEYRQVFMDFVARIPRHGALVACYDDADVMEVAKAATAPVTTYGFLEGADYRITDYKVLESEGPLAQEGAKQQFRIMRGEEEIGTFALGLAGRHNALNATAVIALVHALKLDNHAEAQLQKAIASFKGTTRRFEYIGERFGALIYDDYAHHPAEVKATLRAFRELYPKRKLWAIFHPHTFSRTKALLPDFAQSFDDADGVTILDIYGSAREEQGGVSAQDLVDAINRFNPGKATLAPRLQETLIGEIEGVMGRSDLIVTLGAGDVWQISHQLAKKK